MRIPVIAFLFLFSCTGSRSNSWDQVSRQPTLLNLRNYIFLHPNTEESAVARMQLETLLAREALSDGSIARLQAFLQEFPDGSHAPQVREALMAARAGRALETDTQWALLRFLHLHPKAPQAESVRARLENTWWRELSASPNPRSLLHYVETYPSGKHASEARELLADTLYKKLGPDPAPELLQAFASRHPQTTAGRHAMERLRFWERALVLLLGSAHDQLRILAQGGDFPPDLLEVAVRAHLESALWAFDTDAMASWCAAVKDACSPEWLQMLVLWKKMPQAARDSLAAQVKAAGPFRPMPALSSLEVALQVEDLHTVWMAMESLAWRPEPRAFALLLQQAGAADPAVAWPAASACRKWLSRWPDRGRVLAQWHLKRLSGEQKNYENMARAVLLHSFLGHALPLDDIARLPVTEPVALSTLVLQAETLPQPPWSRLGEEWSAAVNRLRDLFPANLDAGSFSLARNLARRAFVMVQRFETLPLPPDAQGIPERLAEMKKRLSDWETRLASFSGYIRCAENPLPQQEAEHRLVQEPARAKLLADPRQNVFWKTVWGVPGNSPYFPAQP